METTTIQVFDANPEAVLLANQVNVVAPNISISQPLGNLLIESNVKRKYSSLIVDQHNALGGALEIGLEHELSISLVSDDDVTRQRKSKISFEWSDDDGLPEIRDARISINPYVARHEEGLGIYNRAAWLAALVAQKTAHADFKKVENRALGKRLVEGLTVASATPAYIVFLHPVPEMGIWALPMGAGFIGFLGIVGSHFSPAQEVTKKAQRKNVKQAAELAHSYPVLRYV